MSKTIVYCDGSGWNGREAKYCVMWCKEEVWHTKVFRFSDRKYTNNEMEYHAVIQSLRSFSNATIYTDSQLITSQVDGTYKIRQKHLKPLLEEVKRLLSLTHSVLVWIPRKENKAGVWLDNNKSYE